MMIASRKVALNPSWNDHDPILRERWEAGDSPVQIAEILCRSTAAIMTRAARLGLPRRFAPGRKPRHMRPLHAPATARAIKASFKEDITGTKQVRVCLMCVSGFHSSGPHNRICPKCKESPEYASASRLSEHSVAY